MRKSRKKEQVKRSRMEEGGEGMGLAQASNQKKGRPNLRRRARKQGPVALWVTAGVLGCAMIGATVWFLPGWIADGSQTSFSDTPPWGEDYQETGPPIGMEDIIFPTTQGLEPTTITFLDWATSTTLTSGLELPSTTLGSSSSKPGTDLTTSNPPTTKPGTTTKKSTTKQTTTKKLTTTTKQTTTTKKPTTTTKQTTTTKKPTTTTKKPATTTTLSSSTEKLTVIFKGVRQQMDAKEAVGIWTSNEVSSSYPAEAIKAQAVACYTYILYYNKAGSAVNIGSTSANLNNTIRSAVNQVFGKKIYLGSQLAFTPWHSMSIGVTLPSEQVWGGVVANLKAVSSPLEIGTKTDSWNPYAQTKTYTKAQMKTILESYLGTSLSADPKNWIKVENYYSTVTYNGKKIGYVKDCLLDGKKRILGRTFRETVMSYALRSPAFDVSYDESKQTFSITTYGYGHGCGMSQTGAKLYALQGWNYQQILSHYFLGVTVK